MRSILEVGSEQLLFFIEWNAENPGAGHGHVWKDPQLFVSIYSLGYNIKIQGLQRGRQQKKD